MSPLDHRDAADVLAAELGSDGRAGTDDVRASDVVLDSVVEVQPDTPSMVGLDGRSETWVDDCNGTVGRYAGGAIKAPGTAAFERAYLQYFPQLGCPNDNGGGVFVHVPCAGIDVQDFIQKDSSRALSSNGTSMLVFNSGLGRAFVLYDQIWTAYACMHADDCGTAMGGLSLLGPPTSDRYADRASIRQDFQLGWMTVDAAGAQVTVHLAEPRTIDPAALSGCWGDGAAPWITIEGDALDASVADVATAAKSCSQPIAFDNPTTTKSGEATEPSCQLDESGAVVLQYSDLVCPQKGDRPYRGCIFQHDQDMRRFDPDSGGSGVYEVFFCVDGPVNGSVNLWYEQEESSSARRYLPLLAGGEELHGCRRVYVGPGDINRGSPSQRSLCTATYSGKNACSVGDGGLDETDGSPQAAQPQDASTLDAEASPDTQNPAGFRRSKLVLMNEWCDPAKSVSSSSTPVKITLVSVTYHPGECLCRTDTDCDRGSACRRVTWPATACCMCDCPGFCESGAAK